MTKRRAFTAKSAFLFIILWLGGVLLPSAYITADPWLDADLHSHGIMVRDMMYNSRYERGTPFIKFIPYGATDIDGSEIPRSLVTEKYRRGENFDKSLFVDYNSNLAFHRYFYRFFDRFAPLSGKWKLRLLNVSNRALYAAALTAVFLWMGKYLPFYSVAFSALAVTLLSFDFNMFAKNLYWAPRSMIFPMAAMAVFLTFCKKEDSWAFPTKIFLLSLGACLVKCVFYFEFVTSAMIAMTVPLFAFYADRESGNISAGKKAAAFLCAVAGAVSAFLLSYRLHIFFISKSYGITMSRAHEYFVSMINDGSRFVNRSRNPLAAALYIIKTMMARPALSMKGPFGFTVSVGALAALSVLAAASLLYLKKRDSGGFLPFVTGLFFAFIAPLSWYFVGRIHTQHHQPQRSVLWFLPFVPMALAFLASLPRLFSKSGEGQRR